MKSSKWIIGLLVVLTVGLMLSSTFFGWNSNSAIQSMQNNWRGPYHPEFSFPFDIPPLVSGFSALATIFLLSVIVLFLLPKQVAVMSATLRHPVSGTFRLILLGILSAVFVGAIAIGSAFTFITFPLTIVLGLSLLIGSFFGTVSIYYTVGERLFRWANWNDVSPLYRLLLGVVVLHPLVYIPILGDILKIVYASLGLGIIITTRFGTGELWSLRPLMEPWPENSVEDSKENGDNNTNE